MKVIYEKLISEKIHDAIVEAELKGRRIEKIILTQEEHNSLRAEMQSNFLARRQAVIKPQLNMFAGVLLEIEESEEEF